MQDSPSIAVTVTSGVKGYYYYTDGNSSNVSFDVSGKSYQAIVSGAEDYLYNVKVDSSHQYLHVRVIDYAGNISVPTVFKIPFCYVVYFDRNNPNPAYSTEHSLPDRTRSTVQGEMLPQAIPVGVSKALNENKYTRYGYTFQGWSKVPGNNNPVNFANKQVVKDLAPEGKSITLYAVWKPNVHRIIYDKNFSNAELHGAASVERAFDTVVDTGKTTHYVTRPGWTFVGWSWIDGNVNASRDTKDYQPSGGMWRPGTLYLWKDHDITLYAIMNRDLTLKLAYDDVMRINSSEYYQMIWNFVTAFQFNSTSKDVTNTQIFTDAAKRTQGTYVLHFNGNDAPDDGAHATLHPMGGYTLEDGRVASTDLDTDLFVIRATRYFTGWYDKQPIDTGTAVGGSGSPETVTVSDTVGNKYTVTGDKDSVVVTTGSLPTDSDYRKITLYPHYTHTYVILPDATRHENRVEVDADGRKTGEKPDKFIGWFSRPQYVNGERTNNGGIYYGKAGQMIEVTSDMTDLNNRMELYPWFNIAPTIIESNLGELVHDSDLGDGFFEGQNLNYDQILALITSYDVDNPDEIGPSPYIEWNGLKSWLDLYSGPFSVSYPDQYRWLNLYELQMEEYLDAMDEANGWNLTAAEKTEILDHVNKELQNSANGNWFWPKVTGITYHPDDEVDSDRLDMNGNPYQKTKPAKYEQDEASVHSDGLLTDFSKVGKIVIHYEVTDNGAFTNAVRIIKGATNPAGGKFGVDSYITVGFDLVTYVNFNHPPRLSLVDTYMHADDTSITADNIVEWLHEKQEASDREDDKDRQPWWNVDKTSADIDKWLAIMRIYDITFEPAYYYQNKSHCDEVMKIKDIEELFKLKETDFETFRHINNFKVEYDTVDQWGKTASGYLWPWFDYEGSGQYPGVTNVPSTWKPGDSRPMLPGDQTRYIQSLEERTITVVIFNNEDDYDLITANTTVSEKLRYIDTPWLDTLSGNSYWGDNSTDPDTGIRYGYDEMKDTMSIKDRVKKSREEGVSQMPNGSYTGTMEGGQDDNSKKKTPITINDYTD